MKNFLPILILLFVTGCTHAPLSNTVSDADTPLHLLTPDYTVPYGPPAADSVKAVMDRVLAYVDAGTPYAYDGDDALKKGSFRLASYEWGVTYSSMLRAAATTGDDAYLAYATERFRFLASAAPHFRELLEAGKPLDGQIRQMLDPHALDDAGAMCCAMTKAQLLDSSLDLRHLIDNYIQFILHREYRLTDGTLARNRPQANTVWLDDMYMGIPAIAWYYRLTGDNHYLDEALRQIDLFVEKMWVPEHQLFRHGWVEAMDPHPIFHWGRANGWALLTLTEVLDVLPADHPRRPDMLSLYQSFVSGIASRQSSEGFWHQLLDHPDSYLETSATAIFTGCIAHAINSGWLDPLAYGPLVVLGWNAVSTKVDAEGRVHGTCVGTGMGFDAAFYCYRPTHTAAAHGYGPVLMAGAEMMELLHTQHPRLNDSAVQFYPQDYSSRGPIFSVE